MMLLVVAGFLGGVFLLLAKLAVSMAVRIATMAAAGIITILVVLWIVSQ